METQTISPTGLVPFRAGFLDGDLSDTGTLRLAGSRCRECGIALFGQRLRCENCSSPELEHVGFAREGTVHTFTVQRYAPPPPHDLPMPWEPRVVAWIDLDENGPRVLAPIQGDPDHVSIGSRVVLRCDIGWKNAASTDVVSYSFALASITEVQA